MSPKGVKSATEVTDQDPRYPESASDKWLACQEPSGGQEFTGARSRQVDDINIITP